MMRATITAVMLASLASTAMARPPRGNSYKLSEQEAQTAMRDYVGCAVKSSPQLASQAVVEDWEGGRLIGEGSRLVSSDCVRAAGFVRQMRFQPEIFRALIAERLIQRDPTLAPTREALTGVGSLAYNMPWPVRTMDSKGKPLDADAIAKQQQGYDRRVGAIAGQQVGECVVKADPALVRPVFATEAGSEAELSVLKGLTGLLPACVPANKKFSFDRQSLRGSLAMAYYRLALASKGVIWAGNPAPANGAAN